MKYSINEKNYQTAAFLALAPKLFFIIIVAVMLLKECFGEKPDPMDDSINASREIVEHIMVLDSTRNGFRVVYATENSVTKQRLEEIRNRPVIVDAFKRLKADAPVHFSNMVETDIYDFAEFAIKYDSDPAIRIHNIFISGSEKVNMYARPNPNIPDCATFINPNTDQGVQYLSHDDIYYRDRVNNRIYRYWKCYGNSSTSSTDERFSHFSQDERLW
ncbi:hypothetical protein CLV62_15223 [Dysgonomonas alginatilytica]|uniref:Uncharacterized protein n=1 Tax=Dysgonomonas alginatilytica TaxID=1605892 RepID=A0A2V3PJA5_9BACT|nr:hypothetical protein [Dysgonomonas alginatilytica]PXV57439.1 hypothetical protein CLV62_15223 [Dysgonomonas alginatilytica]